MTRKIVTKRGTWKVYGVNIVPTDSLYTLLVDAINKKLLSPHYLQHISGCNAPIRVNAKAKTIDFASF